MKVKDFVEKVEPHIVDDQLVLLRGQPLRGGADEFGIFPENKYAVSIAENKKKAIVHFDVAEDGDEISGAAFRGILHQVLDQYPDHDLVIWADYETGEGTFIELMGDLLWADVECEGDNDFICLGWKHHTEGILGAIANWNRAYIDQMYTRF